jgi:molybdopterin-containing oxidoreductase family iron-sulfur binding subunit
MSDVFKILGEGRGVGRDAERHSHDEHEEAFVPVAPVSERPLDFAAIRAKLAVSKGKRFWQSLEELAETPEYAAFVQHEFPHDPANDAVGDDTASSKLPRRDILKLMAASAALSGLSACTKLPVEKIVPYVKAPEEIIPGKPLFYATSMPDARGAMGLLVESHMGRPTKVEGNLEHPGSLGSTDIFAQASVLTLYDPDRSQVVIREGRISDWAAFLTAVANARGDWGTSQGAGLRILSDASTSPTLGAQMKAFSTMYPAAKWYVHEACGPANAREGTRLAFGRNVNSIYRLAQADVIVSLDADFLYDGPRAVRYAREFADRRRISGPQSGMNRLYVVESTPSNTGAMADHRLPVRCREIDGFARALAAALGVGGASGTAAAPEGVPAKWLEALVRDLQKHRGASLIVAGDSQPPAVHALAHAMNAALGNAGKTIVYTDAIEVTPDSDGMAELGKDIDAGAVKALMILGSNPIYTAATDVDFAQKLGKVPLRIHFGLYRDETAELCPWHVPEAHFLESWSDARGYDGTIGIVQPLIAPLYDGKSIHEMVAVLMGQAGNSSHDIVRDYWKGLRPAKQSDKQFEDFWETTLHDGVMAGTALPARALPVSLDFGKLPATENSGGLEVVFRPDPTIGDGRYANNGWLQELPKPLTKITWDNAVMLAPATAERLASKMGIAGLANGDLVELGLEGRKITGPVWVMPGHAQDSVTVYLGFGRKRAGRVGNDVGFDVYPLRASHGMTSGTDLLISRAGGKQVLATTQHHHAIERGGAKVEEESVAAFTRELVRVATIGEFRNDPNFAKDPEEATSRDLTLYPNYDYSKGNQWGMTIDLNSCTGCGACVVACQSENNIPVVGKEQVIAGRDMQWIRVDNYFRGNLDNPETYYEPVPCQQCENAPCEGVCPVGATVHSPEGLNEMVYNRCVGTRYCSNNCPYKVRRFNFELFSDWTTQSLFGLRNPNVTVRSRGVMEKCTYCVQRINSAKIESEKEDRSVRDGEIVTACEAVCPSRAIVFGNINDPESRVSKLKGQSRNYSLVADLNTRPRTTYLARLRNPNPEIVEG